MDLKTLVTEGTTIESRPGRPYIYGHLGDITVKDKNINLGKGTKIVRCRQILGPDLNVYLVYHYSELKEPLIETFHESYGNSYTQSLGSIGLKLIERMNAESGSLVEFITDEANIAKIPQLVHDVSLEGLNGQRKKWWAIAPLAYDIRSLAAGQHKLTEEKISHTIINVGSRSLKTTRKSKAIQENLAKVFPQA